MTGAQSCKGGLGLYANSRDTIFALASGLGKSAVALFRISGPGCSAALAALTPGGRFPIRRAVLRTLRHPRTFEPIDRALITRFEAPASFTGEDLVELSVTGGRAVISATAEALTLVPGPAASWAGRIRLARLRQRQDRSFGGRRPCRPRRRRDGGATASGAANRWGRASSRMRSDSLHAAQRDGHDRSADRFF